MIKDYRSLRAGKGVSGFKQTEAFVVNQPESTLKMRMQSRNQGEISKLNLQKSNFGEILRGEAPK